MKIELICYKIFFFIKNNKPMTTPAKMDTISRIEFINNCHRLYDDIHGENLVSHIFEPVTQEQLVELINIYFENPLTRWNNINKYLSKNNIKINKATPFYVNALQHYICND